VKKFIKIFIVFLFVIAAAALTSCSSSPNALKDGMEPVPDPGRAETEQTYEESPGSMNPGQPSQQHEAEAETEAEAVAEADAETDAEAEVAQIARQREEELALKRAVIIEQSEALFSGYFYEEAIQLLNEDGSLINDEIESLNEKYQQAIEDLVLFEGAVKHIFFHSLILYPEYLFPNLNIPTGGYNEGFAFKSELERILPQLIERGYVLYNINDVFAKDENGNMTQKDIYLPPGKTPLILSIDDPSYHYGIGFANRMILDENGDLATEVITPSGETIVTYDGDVELVVDNFVREHPEFSYRGHKGIIASTGYMGIFGYDLATERSVQDATAVCEKIKSDGWIFASHSYTHNSTGYWGPNSSADKISYDVGRWRNEIEPVTGRTNIFIAPFGYTLRGAAMDVIINNGYNIYCSVDSANKITVYPEYALMSRIEIGGYSLVRYTDILNRDFFDTKTVIDPWRPPIVSG
jgi:hypothetical protein